MSRAFWVGIFVAGTLLILAGGVFLIGRKEFLFSSSVSAEGRILKRGWTGSGRRSTSRGCSPGNRRGHRSPEHGPATKSLSRSI